MTIYCDRNDKVSSQSKMFSFSRRKGEVYKVKRTDLA